MNQAISYLRKQNLKFWDIRIEESHASSLSVRNKEVQDIGYSNNKSYSIRVLHKNAFGFINSDNFSQMLESARKAVRISKILEKHTKDKIEIAPYKRIMENKSMRLVDFNIEQARKLLIDATDRKRCNNHIKDIGASFSQQDLEKTYYNSEGSEIIQNHQYSEGVITATARRGNATESYSNAFPNFRYLDIVTQRACKHAVEMLDAVELKTGHYDVLLDNELTGVFVHEALGHCLEADNIISRSSVLWDKKGKKIASDKVTVIDDPEQQGYGFYYFDDEGIPGKKTTLIENGLLKGFMHSRETAAAMGAKPTGNGRCQDISTRPIVRMSNTYIKKGGNTFDQLLEKLKNGLYLKGENSGEVDSTTGEFEFSVKAAYEIKNYTVARLFKNVTLVGNLLDIMKNVSAVGNKYDIPKPSYCEKDGQQVPVNGFNPQILIKDALVVGND
ncbi:TldD/PmbA family protein [Candidatus Woesearchaeota archaeon]|nr:TldD/PmbA family protein [Candidatus Woesearchaeota archaeon]